MTREEFYAIADNWYQRTHNLRRVWQNESESDKRKAKAFYLWAIMVARVKACVEVIRKADVKRNEKIPYMQGAITGVNGVEMIVDRNH